MTKALPILHTIHQGGSEWGLSRYSRWVGGCNRKARLDEEAQQNEPPKQMTWSGAAVGTAGHLLMEHHFKGAAICRDAGLVRAAIELDKDVVLQHTDMFEERVWNEALRLFYAFSQSFPNRDHFGTPIGVEVALDSREAQDIARAVGIDPYTLRLDLVTEMGERQLDRFTSAHPLDGALEILKPGFWIVDHKFYARHNMYSMEQSLWSSQFTAYQLAWNAAHPDKPVNGVIQNTIHKLKTPAFKATIIPPPSKADKARLKNLFTIAVDEMTNRPDRAVPSINNCFPFGGICRWLKEGVCDGA